jgi:hypothetical protein
MAGGKAVAQTAPERAPAPASTLPALDPDGRAERTFLVQCIAVPGAGRRVLEEIDVDELLTSEPMRRAARHIMSRPDAPMIDLPDGDEQLARIVADLVSRAGRTPDVGPGRVEHARLVLERSRLDRAIRRARVNGSMDVARLAREREQVMAKIHDVVVSLEHTV